VYLVIGEREIGGQIRDREMLGQHVVVSVAIIFAPAPWMSYTIDKG
jgi:hypothetical protein